MPQASTDRPRPFFARMYARISPQMEDEGMGQLRDELLEGVRGRVVEVGAGNGMNFRHYTATTAAVTAVEPEPLLRDLAARTARDPVAAIEETGFDVVRARRVRFPDGRIPVPAAPHVVGIARRP